MWAEKKKLGKFFNPFFLRSQFIPGGHKIFGMAGSTVDLPPLNLRPTRLHLYLAIWVPFIASWALGWALGWACLTKKG
jgi:hypothetical protein